MIKKGQQLAPNTSCLKKYYVLAHTFTNLICDNNCEATTAWWKHLKLRKKAHNSQNANPYSRGQIHYNQGLCIKEPWHMIRSIYKTFH